MFQYILILMLMVLMYMHIETKQLKVEKIDLSKGGNPIKIAQLSDIHIDLMFTSYKKIKNALIAANPDIIIITGDYIEKPIQISKFISFLDTLPPKPVYACFGNHDYKAFLKNKAGIEFFAKQIEAKGITMLRNANTTLSINGRKINLVGIEDMRYKTHDVKKAFAGLKSENGTTIAFSHNPDILFSMGKNKADLLLTGHFHGGQIWMPFHLEFKLLRHEKLSKMKIYRGLNYVNSQRIYISRGLGNVVFPFRFFSKPEITIFNI